jgi:hypothetical protein
MWYHPKYYEELRKKRKELERQASSDKHEEASSDKHQASSDKQQALSNKRIKIHEAWAWQNGYRKQQASSIKDPGSRYKSSDYSRRATNCRSDDSDTGILKLQASSLKRQASSNKRQASSAKQ